MDPPSGFCLRRAAEKVLVYHDSNHGPGRRDQNRRQWDPAAAFSNHHDRFLERGPLMDWLRRKSAPLSEKVSNAIDETAASMFRQTVVARRMADFDGPRGWNHVAT